MPDNTKPANQERCCRSGNVLGRVVASLVLVCSASGQVIQPPGAVEGRPAALPASSDSGTSDERIEVDADQLEYDRKTGWVHATGNVVIKKGGETLKADRAKVNVHTEEAAAEGNVRLQRGPDQKPWTGTELEYNFGTRAASIADLTGATDPFLLESERSDRDADGNFVVHRAHLTTCTNATFKHYHVRAKTVSIVPDDYLICRSASLWFGPVPVLWFPYWRRDLNDDFGWHFYPGYNSRMGAFLLSSYRFPMTSQLRGETHLDYRTKRGVAVGQDVKWRDNEGDWKGDVELYYLQDDEPIDDDEDAATNDIDEERYRVRFDHEHQFGDRDSLMVSVDYVSDTDVLEDFFESDYRDRSQPENYAVYTYRGNWYVVDVEARTRLNDFYDDLERLPQVSLDVNRRRIAESDFYYDSETSVGYLEKLWMEGSGNDDYSATRLDTRHAVYWPQKHFGWLNVIPRAAIRGTYYSDTFETVDVQTVSTTTTSNSTVTTTNSTTTTEATGADLRTMVEVGVETSFKAFKTWEGGVVSPLRHIIEPYANYTYIPEPNLLSENIYQFDGIDALGEAHYVKLGARNKIQTKHGGSPFDLTDVDVYTFYRFLEDETTEEDGIGDVYMDSETRPSDWFTIEADAHYDVDESELRTFNVELTVEPDDLWEMAADYRSTKDTSESLEVVLTLIPSKRWRFNVYGRHEFEDSQTEEVGGYIQHNWDCMSLRLGVDHIPAYTRSDGTERDAEWSAVLGLWLTAFPDVGFSGKHKH